MSLLSIDEAIAKGMGRSLTVGSLTTPVGGGTVLLLAQPMVAIGVPSGYCIRPLRLSCQVQPGLLAADNDETEILFAVDSLGLWTGDGTSTSEQPSNMRTDLKKGSACRVGSAFTANMTTTPTYGAAAAPVLDMELARLVQQGDVQGVAATVWQSQLQLVYEPQVPPFLVGPCTLLCYFGGTVATIGGFIQAAYVEGRTEEFFV